MKDHTHYTSINKTLAIVVLASAADLASLAGLRAHYHIVYLLTKVTLRVRIELVLEFTVYRTSWVLALKCRWTNKFHVSRNM